MQTPHPHIHLKTHREYYLKQAFGSNVMLRRLSKNVPACTFSRSDSDPDRQGLKKMVTIRGAVEVPRWLGHQKTMEKD